MEKVTKYWNRLPRKVVESPFVQIIQSLLDMI